MRVVSAFVVLLCTVIFLPVISEAAAGRYDEQILQDVNKFIQSKKEYQGVKASVDDQVVLLEGSVNLYIHKMNLEKKVKKIKNVDGIRNHVQVQSNVPDAQLQEALANKLRYDRVGYGIAFNAIGLQVKDGEVTLSGNVHDYPSRDSAIAIAETTPGVKDITDNIEVAPTSLFDDELRVKLYRSIYGNSVLRRYELDPQKPIRIVVDNGHVTLVGVVDSQMDDTLIRTRANAVPDVFSVTDNLTVLNQGKQKEKVSP